MVPKFSLPIVAGPTASGKTAVSVAMAQRMRGEIISCDSMQVYQHLSIGTAKPTLDELRGEACHLIDHVSPNEQYNLGRFVEEAALCIDKIRGRGNQPIICGGTGLYIRGLLYGILPEGKPPGQLREQLTGRLESEGLATLFQELESVDPTSALRYGSNDKQRILRALEIYLSTGTPLSEMHQQDPSSPLIANRMYVLVRDRNELYPRINQRVDAMIANGLIEEIEQYLSMGWSRQNPAFNALGYRELAAAMESGSGHAEAVALMKQKCRNYAKRQETWFRHMPGSVFVNCGNKSTEDLACEILADWEICTE